MIYRGFEITSCYDNGIERCDSVTGSMDICCGFFCDVYAADDDQWEKQIDYFCLGQGHEINDCTDQALEDAIVRYVDAHYDELRDASREYCGYKTNRVECCDNVAGLKCLPDACIDLTVTSPPYDNLRTYNGFTWDEEGLIRELYRVTKPGGVVVWISNDATVNGSETGTSFRQALTFKAAGFNLHDTMIWHKISPFTHKNRYIASFEYMFVLSKGRPKTTNIICDRKNKWAGVKVHGTQRLKADGVLLENNGVKAGREVKEFGARYNVWEMPGDKNNKTGHPAVFPETLARDHIISWSNPGDVVLDPFMGSGTTAAACIKTGRQYIGFELSEEYCKIAYRRIEAAKKEGASV